MRANIMLLMTACIWGTAFSAQRMGMAHMGPHLFNGLRFILGAVALVPAIIFLPQGKTPLKRSQIWRRGACMGGALFLGAWLQQYGICFTTAGKAAFITGLYAAFVPLLGLALGRRYHWNAWLGAALAVSGMYFLCITTGFSLGCGDALVLCSAFFWTLHMFVVEWATREVSAKNALCLSALQFLVCGLLSLGCAFFFEPLESIAITGSWGPLLYTGLMSVGVAYTLQVVAQRAARPEPAAIILCMEAVFGALGGWLFLHETMSPRAILGCALMLAGSICAQIGPSGKKTA